MDNFAICQTILKPEGALNSVNRTGACVLGDAQSVHSQKFRFRYSRILGTRFSNFFFNFGIFDAVPILFPPRLHAIVVLRSSSHYTVARIFAITCCEAVPVKWL